MLNWHSESDDYNWRCRLKRCWGWARPGYFMMRAAS